MRWMSCTNVRLARSSKNAYNTWTKEEEEVRHMDKGGGERGGQKDKRGKIDSYSVCIETDTYIVAYHSKVFNFLRWRSYARGEGLPVGRAS
jgi:hypothetical protein